MSKDIEPGIEVPGLSTSHLTDPKTLSGSQLMRYLSFTAEQDVLHACRESDMRVRQQRFQALKHYLYSLISPYVRNNEVFLERIRRIEAIRPQRPTAQEWARFGPEERQWYRRKLEQQGTNLELEKFWMYHDLAVDVFMNMGILSSRPVILTKVPEDRLKKIAKVRIELGIDPPELDPDKPAEVEAARPENGAPVAPKGNP